MQYHRVISQTVVASSRGRTILRPPELPQHQREGFALSTYQSTSYLQLALSLRIVVVERTV